MKIRCTLMLGVLLFLPMAGHANSCGDYADATVVVLMHGRPLLLD